MLNTAPCTNAKELAGFDAITTAIWSLIWMKVGKMWPKAPFINRG